MALLGLSLFLGGCSSSSLSSMTGGLLDSEPSKPSAPTSVAGAGAGIPPDEVPCPDTAVRTGAATLIVGSGQGEPSPLEVRYQGSIVRIDRECRIVAGTMHIKVGVEGRVIAGPAGGPGSLNVPLRVALVREGINPVTIATQLQEIPVTVGEGSGNVTFTHIYPDVSFPMPRSVAALSNYTVYIGFDPIGAQQKQRPVSRRRAPRR
jgi:hypothetical protein